MNNTQIQPKARLNYSRKPLTLKVAQRIHTDEPYKDLVKVTFRGQTFTLYHNRILNEARFTDLYKGLRVGVGLLIIAFVEGRFNVAQFEAALAILEGK